MNKFKENILRNVWRNNRDFFMKQMSKELASKLRHTDLRLWFTDLNGIQYYQFDEDKPLPVERYGELMGFMQYLVKGFDAHEETMILDEMKKAIANGLKDMKLISRIGFLIGVMEERKKLVIHSELLYNIVAVTCVRQDESIDVFSPKIQKEKIIAFKNYVEEAGSYPFFQKTELKKLNHLLSMSERDWLIYFKESLIKQEALRLMLQRFQSKQESKKENAASGITS